MNDRDTILLVANYDSAVGYAWWLMESFWAKIAERYHGRWRVVLAYPSVSTLPPAVAGAPLEVVRQEVGGAGPGGILADILFLRRQRVRVIYFTDRSTWQWRYALYRLCGVRIIIVHDHTPGLRHSANPLKSTLKSIAHRMPWIGADGAIGATEFIRRRLVDVNRLPPQRCFAAPNGLPPRSVVPGPVDLHERFTIPRDRRIIVMTGRAHRYKGVEFVLECLAVLQQQGCEAWQFLFIGDGPHLEAFRARARELGIGQRCSFPGRQDHVPALLRGAAIAIHPSRGEVGYSLSILEYMEAGLPVVVPDNPSVSGATEHGVTGLLYDEDDVPAAVAALRLLLADEAKRKAMGAQASRAARRYSLDATHRALLDAFEAIGRLAGYPL